MKTNLWLGSILLVSGLALTGQVLAQAPAPGQKPPAAAKEVVFQVTLKGQISYLKNLGGYYLCCTPEEYIIENQNPKVLEAFQKSGKTVTVQGRVNKGTGFLFIEKIDGKSYQGKKEPYSDK